MLRGAGILLHITSLPGGCYVGDLGPEAYKFAEGLADAGQTYWQTLPINHTLPEYENSPYNAVSSFAGDPVLISLDLMKKDGLVDQAPQCPATERADYVKAWEVKRAVLEKALKKARALSDYRNFVDKTPWLEDYAYYMAMRERHGPWGRWPDEAPPRRLVELYKFAQFVFWSQWERLKQYVNDLGILLIGDLPFYPSVDSVDVWRYRQYFKVGDDGKPLYVAGVPPDYYSATGQLWGNPVYNWEALERDGYRWWVERLRHMLEVFDYVRLDHFRGYLAYWEIPGGETTAARGRWAPSPGKRLFDAASAAVELGRLIAEDLGYITPDVEALRDELGLPGMRVLQFAWDGNPANPHKPHNHVKNSVVYTGTHDNNTAVGWYLQEASPRARREFRQYSNCREAVNWCFIKLAYMSVADVAVVPMQDVLGLGPEARMNRPGTVGGNWRWRMAKQPEPRQWRRLRSLARLYGR
ncbi:4-alpha-glucanotransferase [Pyrobaculum ferrireducens]|uniref:4-alpha-glucanotransferase n=1 Tax=Pyrobaculum ferrireducens TaxID=1104324 RepID=G7VD78_9CREN|nr:4-alpha-glucanotransferase [Pyrobaculum ferrireducens]AET33957.1 4-alpha-glucanotransferase (malQ) [Pyrobaculum ferrireducens]